MRSINRQLLALLLTALTVAAVLIGVSSYMEIHEEISELFDYQLHQIALSHRDQKTFDQQPATASDYEKDEGLTVQVWDTSGTLIYMSHRNRSLPRVTTTGLQTITVGNEQWRVYLLSHQGRIIQVSQSLTARQEMSFSFIQRTMIPICIIFAALAVIIWIVVRHALTPLNRIANGVARLSPTSLEPLPENDLPVEILPLVKRLNYLFDQLGHAFDIQKRFVADAAHELRTPLTVIKLQLRILEQSSGEEERIEALDMLKSGVDRAVRLVGQLLALARVEPDAPRFTISEVSINSLVTEIISEQSRIAVDKGITLAAQNDEPVIIMGEPDALRAMISNLVDNAIRYTLPGGKVDVTARNTERTVVIEVADTGPGIPLEKRELIFDRFNRGQRTDATGCGLGMAIVKSAVIRHDGSIALGETTTGKGLKVTIELPRNPLI
jgi:two-component system OmpR family sensor kinase